MARLEDADRAAVQAAIERMASLLGIAATDDALDAWRALEVPIFEATLVARWRALLLAKHIHLDVLVGPAVNNGASHSLYQSCFKPMALACCPSLRTAERSTKTLNTHVLRMWQRVVAGVEVAVSMV